MNEEQINTDILMVCIKANLTKNWHTTYVEIELPDILLAIGQKGVYTIDTFGEIYGQIDSQIISWNLILPYSQQTLETKQFIHDILFK